MGKVCNIFSFSTNYNSLDHDMKWKLYFKIALSLEHKSYSNLTTTSTDEVRHPRINVPMCIRFKEPLCVDNLETIKCSEDVFSSYRDSADTIADVLFNTHLLLTVDL